MAEIASSARADRSEPGNLFGDGEPAGVLIERHVAQLSLRERIGQAFELQQNDRQF